MSSFSKKGESAGMSDYAILVGVVIAAIVGIVCVFGFLTSFKSVDAGEVCVIKEGGPFDGRDVKDVRQPGSGVSSIGIFNDQHCLPATERDSNEVLPDDPSFPTRDSISVLADGQVLFSLTTDKEKVSEFYRKFGRKKWSGHWLWEDEGWKAFLQQRFAPPVIDALRQVIGKNDCTPLNNLCQYVLDPDKAARKGKTEKVDNSQNLSRAQADISTEITARLRAAFGDDYFENVRYQNFRTRFEPDVQRQITAAQAKRTEVANAKLEADRVKEEAKGRTAVAEEQSKQIKIKAAGYRDNPSQARIDGIKAFCGDDGCDPQAVGGGFFNQLVGK